MAAAALCAMTAAGARAGEAPGPGPGAGPDAGTPPGLAGAYLRARLAAGANDYAVAAGGYRAALALAGDEPGIAERAILASLGAGDVAGGAALARALAAAGAGTRIGTLAILTEAARCGDWAAIPALLGGGPGVGPLVDGLARGWAAVGAGDAKGAMAAFDAVVAARGLRAFGLTHKAYALALLGDDARAEAIWSGAAPEAEGGAPRFTGRAATARIAGLSRLGRHGAAALLLERTPGGATGRTAAAMRAALAAGRALPPPVADARAGLAEALFTVAAALHGEAADGYTLLHVRAALALDPAHERGALLAARLLRGLGRPEEAVAAYAAVPEGGVFHAARLGMAATLREAGRGAEAVAVLRALAASHADMPKVHAALGHALQAEGRPAEAVAAYDASLAARAATQLAPWRVLFARARARERIGEWDGARADLRRALEIAPEAPGPMAFLGYAMMVRGERPDEALALLEAAAAARPESGFVAGRLGWALSRMGLHERAARQLERAVRLAPGDAVATDCLGDAYWASGRVRQARLQWSRALAFGPGEGRSERIARKLRLRPGAAIAEGAARAPVPEAPLAPLAARASGG